MKKRVYLIDIDGTVCDDIKNEDSGLYSIAKPYEGSKEEINKLYDEGNTIYIYTARGMGQFNGDLVKVYNSLYVLTLNSLEEWGIKHHGLIMGKLHYDYLIDDKAVCFSEFIK
jgi:hypothetical protein